MSLPTSSIILCQSNFSISTSSAYWPLSHSGFRETSWQQMTGTSCSHLHVDLQGRSECSQVRKSLCSLILSSLSVQHSKDSLLHVFPWFLSSKYNVGPALSENHFLPEQGLYFHAQILRHDLSHWHRDDERWQGWILKRTSVMLWVAFLTWGP